MNSLILSVSNIWGYPTKLKFSLSLFATYFTFLCGKALRCIRPVDWYLTVMIQHWVTPYTSFFLWLLISMRSTWKRSWDSEEMMGFFAPTFPRRHDGWLLHTDIAILAVNFAKFLCGTIIPQLGPLKCLVYTKMAQFAMSVSYHIEDETMPLELQLIRILLGDLSRDSVSSR